MLAAPFEPLVPAPAASVEVVAPHLRAVAVEVDADLVPGAAPRAAALIREGREGRDGYGFRLHVGPFPVARRRRLREARAHAAIDAAVWAGMAPDDPVEAEPPPAS